eukprot:g13221.t1
MRRRHPQGPADSDHHDRAFVSPLQQVLHFGVCDLGRVSGHGHHPPHLASAVSAFLGATGCARLGRCAVGWPHFVPTGLRGEDLQRPAAEKKLEGGWPFLAGAKLMQQPGDRLMMLDTARAQGGSHPHACACLFRSSIAEQVRIVSTLTRLSPLLHETPVLCVASIRRVGFPCTWLLDEAAMPCSCSCCWHGSTNTGNTMDLIVDMS